MRTQDVARPLCIYACVCARVRVSVRVRVSMATKKAIHCETEFELLLMSNEM